MMNPPPSPLRRCLALSGRLATDRRGATAIEYGLILALMTLVMLVALTRLADSTVSMWRTVSTKVEEAK